MADREQKRRKLNPDTSVGVPSGSNPSGHHLHHPPRTRPPLLGSSSFPSDGHLYQREATRSPKAIHKPQPPIFSPSDRSSHATSSSTFEDSKSQGADYRSNVPLRPRLPSHGSQESVPSIVEPGDEIKVDGYRDVRVISIHYDDVVACRAHSIARGDQRVALKFSLSAKPQAAQQFKAETLLLNKLREAGVQNITKVIARESGRYGMMLVAAFDEVKTWTELFKLRERGPPPFWTNTQELVRAIDWAIRLVNLVASIHKQNYVHNSIRPSSVSVSMFSEVYLHDFSCAFSTGGAEGSAPIRERGMKEESLPYMAPECSGRVGKTPDYRSDYYSIGATLFEVFTGHTPFPHSDDPLEIIHSHITKRPPLIDSLDRSLPHGLALIVAKLLEKSPEARYQTPQGLEFDLQQTKEAISTVSPGSPLAWPFSPASSNSSTLPPPSTGYFPFNATPSGSDFAIGAIDESANFKLPPASRLFGREDSVRKLRESYDRVKKNNKPSVVVVKGHSGIGKTSLVETLRAPTLQSRGHFTSVKFDQIKSPVPFFAITQSLNGLFRQLLSEPEARLAVWRRRLQRAVGKEGRVLADVLPSLENVFEPGWLESQPTVATIGAQESEERFQNLVQKVLRIFARADKPLVVLFDDLQWSSPSDLAFIRSLALLGVETDQDPLTCKMANPMLLICAWRDNEVDSTHIVETELCSKLPSVYLTLTLEPLTLQAVSSFVSESLRNPASTLDLATPKAPDEVKISQNVSRLSQLILDKTRGSPLFVSQLLKSFNAEGLFTFNFDTRQWEFDLNLIASKTVSSDVVDLLLVQLRKFPPRPLQVLACLGSEEISSIYLAQAAGLTLTELARDLSEAVSEGLLEARGAIQPETTLPLPIVMEEVVQERDGSRSPVRTKRTLSTSGPRPSIVEPPTVPQFYRFFHDRCQQAAYALIPSESRSILHYSIGRRLVAACPESAVNDRIFDLVTQLNHGIRIIETAEERDRLAGFNFIAGTKAQQSTAFEASRNYLQTAWDLLGAAGWNQQPELMAKVTEALVDVEYSLTDYAAAQEYIRLYLAHVPDVVAKLRVYARSIRCASAVGDSRRAIELGREGLAMAGVDLPDDEEKATQVEGIVRSQLSLGVRDIQNLAKSAVNQDPVARGCQSILAALVPPIYFVRIDLLGVLSSLSLSLSVTYGLDDNGAFMLTLHAILVRNKYRQHAESLAYGQTAIKFFDLHGGTPLACATYKVYSSHVAVWAMPIVDTLPTFRHALAYGLEYRDAEYAGFGCGEYCLYSIFAGIPLSDIDNEVERYGLYVRKFRHEISTTYIGVVQQFIACMSGKASDPIEIEGPAFTSTDYQLCRDKGYALSLHMIHMLRLAACVFFGDFEKAQHSIEIGRQYIEGASGLLYPSLFRVFEAVVLYQRFGSLRPEELDILEETKNEISELAEAQETTFRPLQLWLKAEAARCIPDSSNEALSLFDEAIQLATATSQNHLSAILNERAAATLANPKLAVGYIVEAHSFWAKWGCTPKVHHLEVTFPSISFPNLTSNGAVSRTMSSGASSSDLFHDLDGDTALRSMGPGMDRQQGSSNGGHTEETISLRSSLVESGPASLPSLNRRRSDSRSLGSQGSLDDYDHPEGGSGRSIDRSEHFSRSHLATELDLRTVITVQNLISGEGSVDGVVSKLLNLALRTVGAEMCLLVLDKSGTLCAEAIARSEVSSVQHLRRTDSIDSQPERFPTSVINLVARTKEMVVNSLDSELTPDPYLARHRPKSILCHALVASHGRVIGILYLENTQTQNAFTPDRLEILSLVSGQAASMLEKARLVSDLSKTNENLKRSQAALESSNRTLETRIAERTASLQAEVKEKERAQAEMLKSKEVAESATAQKSQFLANMSHEIRTPFNAVVALSGLLLETPLTPVQTDYIETIKNSSQELLVVINDILDYSKIELDHLELSREPVQVRSVLESSMDMVAERAASKHVELALLIEEGDVHVYGDVTRLRQIVVNLLSNAVKFTQNGEIKVTASSSPAPPNSSGNPQAVCRISVQDSGIGIARENFSKLFQVYSQAEGAQTSANFGGTGLGLAISRKLSQLMDGDISVESEIGKGSTFTLQWIARTVTTPTPDPYSPSNCRDLVGRRCLVVDSHATSRTVLEQLLGSFGIEVTAPEDPSHAYELAMKAVEEQKPYEFFIVDAFLPSFGAHTLIRRLRGRGLSAPTIALTRMGSPIYEEIRQLDCSFLIKPIKRNRLHHALRTIFPAAETPRVSSPRPSSPAFPTNLSSRNPLSILCAEDNPVNVKVLTHLLKRMGYSADVAEDGQIAFEKVQKKRYDLVLMDVNMPNMDGITSTKKIIELLPDRNSRPSIVCLTANAMSEDKARCLASGADSYVSKPVMVPELLKVLEEAGVRRKASMASRTTPLSIPSPSTSSTTPPFELELPTSRLGRAERKGSTGSTKSLGTAGSSFSEKSSPSGSPLALTTNYISEDVSTKSASTSNGGSEEAKQ
ncbi:uncharacterized protein JCM6883_002039 [Sporobolomyces salmoneus]|uniref:uncharacterized protein n=1 Tax=Sporobolomyces salmoneus TaxID=183962 RepID=UPI00317B7510